NLEERLKARKIKPSTVHEFKSARKRLERVEVGGTPASDLIVRHIDDDQAKAVFHAVRLAGMRRSNRIPTRVHQALAGKEDYADPPTQELARVGLTGKRVPRVRSAGLAVAEATLSAAIRAVDFTLERELADAQRLGRAPLLVVNSLRAVYKAGLFRRPSELRE